MGRLPPEAHTIRAGIPPSSPDNIVVNVTPSRELGFRPISPSDSRTTEVDASTTRSLDEQTQDRLQLEDTTTTTTTESLLSGKPSSRMLLNLRGERGEHPRKVGTHG